MKTEKESMEFLAMLALVMDATAMGCTFEDKDGNPVSAPEAAIRASRDKNHGLVVVRN
jgi:hypothetical protein